MTRKSGADNSERHAFDYRGTAWAVRPETLAWIQAVAAGAVHGDPPPAAGAAHGDAAADPKPEAALRAATSTGGVAVLSLRGLITPRPSFLSLLFGGGGGLQSFRGSLREAVG